MDNLTNKEMYLIDAKTMWDCPTCYYYNKGHCSKNIWCDAGESYRPAFDKLKMVDAKPIIHGHWVYNVKTNSFDCTNCNESMVRNVFNYCPWCGAKMDEIR